MRRWTIGSLSPPIHPSRVPVESSDILNSFIMHAVLSHTPRTHDASHARYLSMTPRISHYLSPTRKRLSRKNPHTHTPASPPYPPLTLRNSNNTIGTALPAPTLVLIDHPETVAILFGAIGGPKWPAIPGKPRPEEGALYWRGMCPRG